MATNFARLDDMDHSTFLELPQELRNLIYDCALSDVVAYAQQGLQTKLIKSRGAPDVTHYYWGPGAAAAAVKYCTFGEGSVGLLFASHQIHDELFESLNKTVPYHVTIRVMITENKDHSLKYNYVDESAPIFPTEAEQLVVRIWVIGPWEYDHEFWYDDVDFQTELLGSWVYEQIANLVQSCGTVKTVDMEWGEHHCVYE